MVWIQREAMGDVYHCTEALKCAKEPRLLKFPQVE